MIAEKNKRLLCRHLFFSVIINGKALDEVKHGVGKHGLSSAKDVIAAREKSANAVCGLENGKHI